MKSVVRSLVLAASLVLVSAVAFAGSLGAFSITDSTGAKFSNENLKKDKTVMVFAQTACAQCRNEISELNKVYEDLKGKADIYIVLVDVNTERAVDFFTKQGVKIPLLLDPDFTLPNAAGVTATPATIIVNKKGEISFTETGYSGATIDKIKEAL